MCDAPITGPVLFSKICKNLKNPVIGACPYMRGNRVVLFHRKENTLSKMRFYKSSKNLILGNLCVFGDVLLHTNIFRAMSLFATWWQTWWKKLKLPIPKAGLHERLASSCLVFGLLYHIYIEFVTCKFKVRPKIFCLVVLSCPDQLVSCVNQS